VASSRSSKKQLDFEGAVVLQLGRSAAGDLVTLVKATPAKEDDAPPVFEFATGVDRAKSKLGPALGADLEIGRSDEIEVIAIPQIGRATIASDPSLRNRPGRSCRRDQLWRPHEVVGSGGKGEDPLYL